MTTQPEALRMADQLDRGWAYKDECSEIATELRRQHEENEGLRRERDEARRTVRDAHEAGTRLTAQRDALLAALEFIVRSTESPKRLRPLNLYCRQVLKDCAAIKAVEEGK